MSIERKWYKSRGGRIMAFSEEEVEKQWRLKGKDSWVLVPKITDVKFSIKPKHKLYYPFWDRFLMSDGYGQGDYMMRTYAKDYGVSLTKNKNESIMLFYNNIARLESMAKDFPGKVIAFTMWETTQMPPRYVEAINKYADVLVVPHDWNTDGIEIPTIAIGMGVDSKFFHYFERDDKPETFKFLHTAGGNRRKGWELVIQAFKEEFAEDEDVELTMKMYPWKVDDAMFAPFKEIPRVTWDDRDIPKALQQEFYQEHHCLVFPSKGEGWGLVPHEAVITGMPAIVTRNHGFDGFWNEGFVTVRSEKKPSELVPPEFIVDGVDLNARFVDKRWKNTGDWYQANMANLKTQMRNVYEDYKKYKAKAKNGSEYLLENFNEKAFMTKFVKMLDDVCKEWK